LKKYFVLAGNSFNI